MQHLESAPFYRLACFFVDSLYITFYRSKFINGMEHKYFIYIYICKNTRTYVHIRYIHTVPFPQVVDESESLSHQLLLSQWEEEEEERRHTFTIASRDQQQHKKIKQRAEVQIYWSKQTQHATMNGGQVKPTAVFLMLGWCCHYKWKLAAVFVVVGWCCTDEINMPLQTEAK